MPRRGALTRDKLLRGYLDRAASKAGITGVVAKREREKGRLSFLNTHNGGESLWVFAYGSLIWNPAFHYREYRAAQIYGYHRSFCIWSRFARGTVTSPGLTLGLDKGGSCNGIAYQIDSDEIEEETTVIWAREMLTDAYLPVWATIRTPRGMIRGITFVANKKSHYYAGRLSEKRQVKILSEACGVTGSAMDYLAILVQEIEKRHILAPSLSGLYRKSR